MAAIIVSSPGTQTNKTFDKISKLDGTTLLVDDNISKPKLLPQLNAVQSFSLSDACWNSYARQEKKTFFKVKSAKNNITRLFKSFRRVSEVVTCINHFAISNVEQVAPGRYSSSSTPSSIAQHEERQVHAATAHDFIATRNAGLKAIVSPAAYDENTLDEHTQDIISSVCSLVNAPSPPPTGQLFAKSEFQVNQLASAFLLRRLHTIEEEDGNAEAAGVANMGHKALAISDSFISRSNDTSGVTTYISSDTISDYTTTHVVNSETDAPSVDTSFATSIYAEDSYQLSPGVLRVLRRVPKYEDLRTNLQVIANDDSACSDLSCRSSNRDSLCGEASSTSAAPLRRLMECNDLRKSFLSFEPIHLKIVGHGWKEEDRIW